MQVNTSAAKVLERYASIDSPRRAAAIDDWLDDSFSDLESQNNTLYAATHILRGDWDTTRARAWRFVGIGELDPGEEPTDKDIHGAWSRLKKRLDDAKQKTPTDFDGLIDFAEENGIQELPPDEYLTWFYRYKPYLTLNLEQCEPPGPEFMRRLDWFLKPVGNPDYAANIRHHGDTLFFAWRASRTVTL